MILITLATACGSGGGSSGGLGYGAPGAPAAGSSGALGSGPPAQLPATPPDVPSQAPTCTGSLYQQVKVEADLQSLVSACATPQGDQMELTNLSQYVLDVAAVPPYSSQLDVSQDDTSSNSLPTLAGQLEVEAQNAVVAEHPDGDPSADLLPVGGTVTATSNDPQTSVHLSVTKDPGASWKSFEAAAMTSYVVSNVLDQNPDDYYQAIADCVNNSYQLWQDQQTPTPVAQKIYDTLQAGVSCADLKKKVNDYLSQRGQQQDLAAQAQRAGENVTGEEDWASKLREEQTVKAVDATLR